MQKESKIRTTGGMCVDAKNPTETAFDILKMDQIKQQAEQDKHE